MMAVIFWLVQPIGSQQFRNRVHTSLRCFKVVLNLVTWRKMRFHRLGRMPGSLENVSLPPKPVAEISIIHHLPYDFLSKPFLGVLKSCRLVVLVWENQWSQQLDMEFWALFTTCLAKSIDQNWNKYRCLLFIWCGAKCEQISVIFLIMST